MLETLVLSLGLLDQTYFLREDLRSRFFELLERLADRQVVVLLGAPAKWDASKTAAMPYYAAYKWMKGPSTPAYPPADFGFVVVSSLVTDEIRIVPLVDNSHKIPLSRPRPKSPPPPGTDLDKLTTSYDEQWNQILSKDIVWSGGHMAMAVICGPVVSNVCKVNIVNQPAASVGTPERAAHGPAYHFVKSPQSPPLPGSIGISLSIPPLVTATEGKPCAIHGSFTLPYSGEGDVVVHILLSQPEAPGIESKSVTIPKAAIVIDGGMARGYFLFDLMETMYWKRGEKFSIPKSLFISAVHKDVFSSPQRCAILQ